MRTFIGITIGPIFETITEADRPAALWFSSMLFSDLNMRLCIALKDAFRNKCVIHSPYFPSIKDKLDLSDGVGKYHDRIFAEVEEYDREKLEELIQRVKKETILRFPQDYQENDYEKFLLEYLQVSFVAVDSEKAGSNCILTLGPYLDLLELMRSFPADNKYNPFQQMYRSGDNQQLKDSPLFRGMGDNNQFIRGGYLRDIPSIAAISDEEDKKKISNYFAIVSADGDRVGKLLETLDHNRDQTGESPIQRFSKACLEYNGKAADLVGDFGGMTLYAGGDDLLFLAPLSGNLGSEKNASLFQLCARLDDCFISCLKKNGFAAAVAERNPSVSFGIAIRYCKFPLYEAFSASRALLEQAKSSCPNSRKRMAVDVQKHSGQSIGLMIPNECARELDCFMKDGHGIAAHSCIYTMENFRALFTTLAEKHSGSDKDTFVKIAMNMFDNDAQKQLGGFLETVLRFLYSNLIARGDGRKILCSREGSNDIDTITAILRYLKFQEEELV